VITALTRRPSRGITQTGVSGTTRSRRKSPAQLVEAVSHGSFEVAVSVVPLFLFRELERERLDLADQTQHLVVVASHDGGWLGSPASARSRIEMKLLIQRRLLLAPAAAEARQREF
jgi:hypothetical protein